MTSESTIGPLRGIRVLDLTRVMAGPWATQLLGDLGANVIKIERPRSGDDSRAYGPPFFRDCEGVDTAHSAMFQCANRNKRSITIDIEKARGQALVKRLAANADVLIENFRVGVLSRLGLGYDELVKINSRLIYCSVTGYGQTGPYKDRGGYDPILQAMSGMMSLTGNPAEEGGCPMKVGPPVIDISAGLYAVAAIQAALYERDARGGQGRSIDVSLLDTGISLTALSAMKYLASGQIPTRTGTQLGSAGSFQAIDGHVMIAPGTQKLWAAFCHALDRPDLAVDPRFSTHALRLDNLTDLRRVLDAEVAKMTVAEVHRRMVEANVPSSPVYNVAEALDDPHVRHRQVLQMADHSVLGPVPTIANPIRATGMMQSACNSPPGLGEHTDVILREDVGLSESEIEELRRDGIV